MPELLDLIPPVIGDLKKAKVAVAVHAVIALLVFILISLCITSLSNATITPQRPIGANNLDYDALKGARGSLADYLSANDIPDSTPMVQFSVATANFGAMFTESIGLLNPWNSSVSPEAARLQVEAGARAIVFDIWPDPTQMTRPVITAMLDMNEWWYQNWWRSNGMNRGAGRYSNWQRLSRNKIDAGEGIKAAIQAAFGSSPGPQNDDPFFLILRLHGAMTKDYLNRLGETVRRELKGHAMGAEWGKAHNQSVLCSAKVSDFKSRAFVIVIPDIHAGYNSLPGINNYPAFISQYMNTVMGEATNAIEATPNTIAFQPGGIAAISVANQPNCSPKDIAKMLTPAQAGFCVVQPTIGGQTTENPTLFKDNNFTNCIQSGAQFVAVNLFSNLSSDPVLNTWFSPSMYGKYSFQQGESYKPHIKK